jgi:hypothetical protein
VFYGYDVFRGSPHLVDVTRSPEGDDFNGHRESFTIPFRYDNADSLGPYGEPSI